MVTDCPLDQGVCLEFVNYGLRGSGPEATKGHAPPRIGLVYVQFVPPEREGRRGSSWPPPGSVLQSARQKTRPQRPCTPGWEAVAQHRGQAIPVATAASCRLLIFAHWLRDIKREFCKARKPPAVASQAAICPRWQRLMPAGAQFGINFAPELRYAQSLLFRDAGACRSAASGRLSAPCLLGPPCLRRLECRCSGPRSNPFDYVCEITVPLRGCRRRQSSRRLERFGNFCRNPVFFSALNALTLLYQRDKRQVP